MKETTLSLARPRDFEWQVLTDKYLERIWKQGITILAFAWRDWETPLKTCSQDTRPRFETRTSGMRVQTVTAKLAGLLPVTWIRFVTRTFNDTGVNIQENSLDLPSLWATLYGEKNVRERTSRRARCSVGTWTALEANSSPCTRLPIHLLAPPLYPALS